MNGRCGLLQRHGHRHFGLYGVGLGADEARLSDCAIDRYPPLVSRMVIGKYQQAVVVENAPTLGKDRREFLREKFGIGVLYLARTSRSRRRGKFQHLIEPIIKEVRELRIVNIIKKRRIRDDNVDALGGEIQATGISRGEIGRLWLRSELLEIVGYLC